MSAIENKQILPTSQFPVSDIRLELAAPETATPPKVTYSPFNKKDELLLLAIPVIAVVLTIALWILGRFDITTPITDLHQYLNSLIFLDSVHIVFTFVMMSTLPELQRWSMAKEAQSKRGWLKGFGPAGRTVIVALVIGVIVWILKVNPDTKILYGMATMFLFFELLGPSHHTLAQMRGISFTYNSAIRKNVSLSDDQKSLAARCEKMEKLFFNLLLTGEVVYWLPEIFKGDKTILPGTPSFQLVGATLAIGSAVALVVNGLYFPHQEKSHKGLFLIRAFLFPLKMLSVISALGIRAAHGTEYLIVFRKMVQNSELPKPKKSKVFYIATFVSAVYLIPFTLMGHGLVRELTGFQESDRLLATALIGTFAIRFAHFYLDSVMFKMSESATRAAVAPLLSATPAKANVDLK